VDEILSKMEEKYKQENINNIDGVKIDFPTEWVHLRKSNTEPIIRIYAESTSNENADALANKIIADIKDDDLRLEDRRWKLEVLLASDFGLRTSSKRKTSNFEK
jgi:hypothetical protein